MTVFHPWKVFMKCTVKYFSSDVCCIKILGYSHRNCSGILGNSLSISWVYSMGDIFYCYVTCKRNRPKNLRYGPVLPFKVFLSFDWVRVDFQIYSPQHHEPCVSYMNSAEWSRSPRVLASTCMRMQMGSKLRSNSTWNKAKN